MRNDMDLFAFKNQVTIQDLSSDLDIKDTKWDFVFDYLIEETTVVYFEGFKQNFTDADYLESINHLSEKIILDNDHYVLLLKVKAACVSINRSLLSKVWGYYDRPTLYFFKDDLQEEQLINLCDRPPVQRIKMTQALHGVFMAYQASQYDVLWLEKSSDLSFPWKTERSPIALEKEANRSWLEKALNSLGIFWSVKINREKD